MAVHTPKCTAIFADRHPLVPGNTFDNDSTTTTTVNLGAAIPEALHRLPFFSIMPFVHNNVLSFSTQVRPVISVQAVFPEDVLHATVDLRDRACDFPLPPRV